MSHLLWIQHSRSAYSSTSTKCPTCCEYNTAEVHTATQVQNVPPAVNTTQQKCLQPHKYKMSCLLWIQPGHGCNTAHRWKSTYTVLVDLLLGFSLGFSSSGMGGISSSTLPFSSIPISASVRLASQLWVFFSVNSFSWSARKNTVNLCTVTCYPSIQYVCLREREREIVRECVWLCVCVCVCMCACVPVCAYVHACYIEKLCMFESVLLCALFVTCMSSIFSHRIGSSKTVHYCYHGKMPITVIVTLSLWTFNGNEMLWAKHILSAV